MSTSFAELAGTYGSPEAIPNRDIYDCINRKEIRDTLAKSVTAWRDHTRKADDAKKPEEREVFLKAAQTEFNNLLSLGVVKEVRRRCKSNLEFMVCYITWETNPEGEDKDISENRITPESHGPILDFFVTKDDTKPIRDQDPTYKERLLLWPRGGMKSTIDVVDSVQWIINFPEIRILYLTGDDDLAQGFVKETKGHFLIKPDKPSLMNLFFPEFCFEEKEKGNVFEFNNPVWLSKKIFRKEPTVQASSVGSGLGGRHYEVVKPDDAVYDRNSDNEQQCQKIARKISVTVAHGKALRPWGYLDGVGTRYDESDWYGHTLSKNEFTDKNDVKITNGKCWTLIENPSTRTKILIGRAIVIKPEVADRLAKENKPVNYIEAGPDGCDLLLPDIMPYSFLVGSYTDNEDVFEGQLNQNPRSAKSTTFDLPLLLRSTVPFSEMPYRGPMSQTWDFAGPWLPDKTKKGRRDFCTASNAIWDTKGVCIVNDLVRNRFKPADLAQAVVDFAAKHHPFVVGIEDAAGARYLEPQIIEAARRTGDPWVVQICSKIDWITPENQHDAKNMRMAEMHPLLVHGLLKFAAHMPQLQTLYKEFESCLHRRGHDDIPDVISRQRKYAPRVSQMLAKPENSTMSLMSQDQASFNLLYEDNADAFGRIGFGAPPVPIIALEPEPELHAEVPADGLDCILGAGLGG